MGSCSLPPPWTMPCTQDPASWSPLYKLDIPEPPPANLGHRRALPGLQNPQRMKTSWSGWRKMGLRPPRYPLHFPAQEGERKATPGVRSTPSPRDAPTAPTRPTQDAGLGSALGKRRNHTKAPPGTLRPGSAARRRMFIEGAGLGEHREALMEAGGGGGGDKEGRRGHQGNCRRVGCRQDPSSMSNPQRILRDIQLEVFTL